VAGRLDRKAGFVDLQPVNQILQLAGAVLFRRSGSCGRPRTRAVR
jgi:hypothetical protein